MRVDLHGMPKRLAADPFGNRFGLGLMRGLGADCIQWDEDNNCIAEAATIVSKPDLNKCDPLTGFDGYGVACSGTETAGNYVTPADGEYITNCTGYDSAGNCVTCGAGYKLNGWGGAYTSCDSIGGLPGTKKPAVQASGFQSILNSISNIFKPTVPIAAASAGACVAAGGQWAGTKCLPKSSISLGGTAISMSTLLILGVVAVVVLKKR